MSEIPAACDARKFVNDGGDYECYDCGRIWPSPFSAEEGNEA